MATEREQSIKKINELIKDMQVGMMTTADEDGTLRSRPMYTQEMDDNGDLWFFTSDNSAKVEEIQKDHNVNISYADRDKENYVSISGVARLVKDKKRIKDKWSPFLKTWFPDGPDDPHVALLRVTVEKAEYWDSPSGKLVTLVGFIKSVITRQPADDMGENEKVQLRKHTQ
jgi:general stress protein 26